MALIDFDEQFRLFTEKWFNDNSKKYKKIEEMEAVMPEVYMRWENTPAKWLDGLSPIDYFGRFKDAQVLLDMLIEYSDANISIPDLLLNRIVDIGKEAEEGLIDIAFNRGDSNREASMTAINLLNEIQSTKSLDYYIDVIKNRKEDDEIADCAVDALLSFQEDISEWLISILESTENHFARLSLIDILSNYPKDERVCKCMIRLFVEDDNNKALLASFLGKYGNDKAIPVLKMEIMNENLSYLDYIEIKNAIEELGGHIDVDRDFSGDKYYEALKNI